MLRNMQGLHAPLKLQMELNTARQVIYMYLDFKNKMLQLNFKNRKLLKVSIIHVICVYK